MNAKELDSHKKINETINTSLIIFIVFMVIGFIIVAGYLAWGISVINKKGEAGNGQKFGFNYVRTYHPPLTTDK